MMGGSPNLLMPVNPTYTASWLSHTHRSPKSTEPGTDMFVPIGTPIYSPADGHIYGYGATIRPATGRWVGVDFDNGLRFRCMHLSRLVRTEGPVKRGDLLGYSGASGYGYEDWSTLSTMPGAHTHVTLWPTHSSRFGYQANGLPFTVDFMEYVGGDQSSGGGSTPPKEWDEMATEQQVFDASLRAARQAVTENSRAGAYKVVGQTGGTMYLSGPGGYVHISNPDDLALLRRYVAARPFVSADVNNGGEETFTEGQNKKISQYLARLAPLT